MIRRGRRERTHLMDRRSIAKACIAHATGRSEWQRWNRKEKERPERNTLLDHSKCWIKSNSFGPCPQRLHPTAFAFYTLRHT